MRSMASSAEPQARMTLREQQKLYTRQRLIDASIEVFDQQGYAATTIDDIVAAAGASRATFYLHFKSKLEIARELERREVEALKPLWQDLAALKPTDISREVIEGWLERAFDFYRDLRLELKAVQEAIAVEPELREDVIESVEHAVDVVAPLIAASHPRADKQDARIRAAMLVWQHERFAYFWILRGMEFDADHVLRVFADVWMEALAGVAAPKKAQARGKRASSR